MDWSEIQFKRLFGADFRSITFLMFEERREIGWICFLGVIYIFIDMLASNSLNDLIIFAIS